MSFNPITMAENNIRWHWPQYVEEEYKTNLETKRWPEEAAALGGTDDATLLAAI